jgi:hypothetical protein
MKPFRGPVWMSALLLLASAAAPTQAAWCNVFQVTCCHKFHRAQAAASYYAPATVYSAPPTACCQPCPPVCTTRYVQRCYYQPVVTYQQRSYYEPVTTYRTSYYCEPVTSYRYSCYYDPCTCSYQQVACPTTSYRMRSQTCAVQSWVQRCASVPVTSYQQCSYWEPVTTCCTPTPAPACPPQDCAPAPGVPSTTPPPPAASEPRAPGAPGVTEYPSSGGAQNLPYQRYYPTPPSVPPASGSSYQPLPPAGSVPQRQSAPAPLPPSVHLDRIVAIPLGEIEGQVVGRDKLPSAGAQLLFVSAESGLPRQTIAADGTGRFRVALASGGWLVYLQGGDGKPIFQHKVQILANETRQVNLVNG